MTCINYEYDRIYLPEKKYNIPKRTTIGRQCEDDPSKMYPNPNFLKYFPDAALPEDEGRTKRSSCLRIGAYLVIRKAAEESFWTGSSEIFTEGMSGERACSWILPRIPSSVKTMRASTIRTYSNPDRICGYDDA